MRIGLIMQGGDAWIGGSEYIKNLVQAVATLPASERKSFELFLIARSPQQEELLNALRPHVDGILFLEETRPADSLTQRVAMRLGLHRPVDNAHFKRQIREGGIGLLYPITYDNNYNIRVRLPLTDAGLTARWIGWIPDFQHKYLPELFRPEELARREEGISILARDARVLVFSSESAAADFRRFYPESRAAIKVLRFCTSPSPAWYEGDPQAARTKYHLPERFFLVSNQWWRHKNHLLVFEALQLLASEGVRPFVVFTGSPLDFRDQAYVNVVLQRAHELGIAGQVALLGLVPRADQIQLMRGAVAVIQPSLFEGWSTVVEDARALGRPMILSDFPVHLEQNPPASVTFERTSAKSLAKVLRQADREWAWPLDSESQRRARDDAARNLREFGKTFLAIAQSV